MNKEGIMPGIETLTELSNPEERPPAFEPIALDLGESDVEEAMSAFFDFLQLPPEERAKVMYYDESRPRTGKAGYEHKGIFAPDGSPMQDNKHLFHYVQGMDGLDFTFGKNFASETRNFLSIAKDIHTSLAESTKQKYQELEEEIPMLVGIHFPRSGKLEHHLRFLAYQASRNDGRLARGHYDKGTSTIAVAASHPGLRVGFGEDDLTPVDQSAFNPQHFMGYGWHQLAEMLDVDVQHKAGWHDVLDEGGHIDEDVTRWALVYFVDPAGIYYDSTQEQTHNPINWRNAAPFAQTIGNESFIV